MLSLLKLLKALNSSTKEYQLSLAFTFGLLSGLLPFFSLINLVILLIVFTINVPIGIYFIFAFIFSFTASFFDPMLHDFGMMILTSSPMEGFFTSLYNNPIALWLNFNHSITMGGVILGVILAVPSYFISKKLFIRYRTTFEKYFKDSKVFGWLNPYSEKNLSKKQPFLRWWGGALFVGVVCAMSAFIIILFDPIVKFTLEYGISKATNGNFIIHNLTTNLNDTTLRINDVRFTKDSKTHLIESINIELDGTNLLRKKTDIKEFTLKNIKPNQQEQQLKRATISKEVKEILTNGKDLFAAQGTNALALPDINTIIEKEDLKSLQEAKAIKERFTAINSSWKEISSTKLQNQNFDIYKKEYNEVLRLSKNIKSLDDVKNIYEKSKILQAKIKELKNEYTTLKEKYNQDKQTLSNDYKKIKTLPQEDYNYLVNKYQFNSDGALNIVGTYISEDLALYTKEALKYYQMIKPYLQSDEEDIKVVRKKGIWVKYKEINPYPNFVVQKLYANVVNPKAKRIALQGSYFDSLKLNFLIDNYKKENYSVDKNLLMKTATINMDTKINLDDFTYAKLDSKTLFTKVDFEYLDTSSKSKQIIKKVLDSVKEFDLNAKGSIDVIKEDISGVSLNSNLDKKLSSAMKDEVNNQLTSYKSKLKSTIQEKLQNELGNMNDSDFKAVESLLKGNLSSSDNLSKLLQDNLSQKSLNKILEEKVVGKQKDKIENKLKDKLKSLF
jgi:uncharacterized protein (TIGR03546 family)